MTPLPKKKHTRSRSNKRKNASSKAWNIPNLAPCPSCGKLRRPHLACPHCGEYKGTSNDKSA